MNIEYTTPTPVITPTPIVITVKPENANLQGRKYTAEDGARATCVMATVSIIGAALVPYIIGAPMWIVGSRDQNQSLITAGQVFVIGGIVLEVLIACCALAIANPQAVKEICRD